MADLTYPHTLTNGSTPDADQVQANFDAIKTLIESLDLDNLSSSLQGALVPAGSVTATARTTAPTGWLLCQGQAVSRTTYADLFSAIGTTFGAGDGTTTFNLPNLKGKVPVGVDSSDADFNDPGDTAGEKTHTLTSAESGVGLHSHGVSDPGHVHTAQDSQFSNEGYQTGSTGGYIGTGTTVNGPLTLSSTTGISIANASAAASSAHNNVQPSIALHYMIKT